MGIEGAGVRNLSWSQAWRAALGCNSRRFEHTVDTHTRTTLRQAVGVIFSFVSGSGFGCSKVRSDVDVDVDATAKGGCVYTRIQLNYPYSKSEARRLMACMSPSPKPAPSHSRSTTEYVSCPRQRAPETFGHFVFTCIEDGVLICLL